ncbi:MAG: hypothetical protein HC942_26475 [Microcoleus sp. SU_5_6]|nr:hypothetical protein [Microcoleus sp. SU_5_6]NJL69227.1 hypothetical protein [Microcoleus sp. SM1_3_4]
MLPSVFDRTDIVLISIARHCRSHYNERSLRAWTLALYNCQLSTVNYQLSTVNYQLSTINYQLPTINYQLSTVNYQLSNSLPAP